MNKVRIDVSFTVQESGMQGGVVDQLVLHESNSTSYYPAHHLELLIPVLKKNWAPADLARMARELTKP